jgi:hypothetical protein
LLLFSNDIQVCQEACGDSSKIFRKYNEINETGRTDQAVSLPLMYPDDNGHSRLANCQAGE